MTACPYCNTRGCSCPVSQSDPGDIPEIVDMRDPDRHHYPHLYVEPIPEESNA